MVGYPADVRDVILGEDGVLAAATPGTLLIDMTTSEPSLAREIHAVALERGVEAIDAPVSGGDVGARNATLVIMAGGAPEAFERARPLFEVLGSTIVHQGGPGAGQHAKMVNQIAISSGMIGVCEALLYAQRAGLDVATVLDTISGGAAGSWSLSNLAPRTLRGDFEPASRSTTSSRTSASRLPRHAAWTSRCPASHWLSSCTCRRVRMVSANAAPTHCCSRSPTCRASSGPSPPPTRTATPQSAAIAITSGEKVAASAGESRSQA